MNKHIESLQGTIPFTKRKFSISLNGKSLVITGGNGSGKTRLLTLIHKHISLFMNNPEHLSEKYHLNNITLLREKIKQYPKGTDTHNYLRSEIDRFKVFLEEIKSVNIELSDRKKKILLSKMTKSLLRFYPADRKSSILEPNSTLPLNTLIQQEYDKSFDSNAGEQFENYLVSYKTLQSHLIAIKKDIAGATKIQEWFDKIESDFQNLFEDTDLSFEFEMNEQRFYFNQPEKEKYTLQSLSAGYSAVMSIYSDLIMKVQFQEIPPEDLRGIIFIDEIDAHLHVTIQKKILSFLKNSFPSIQFIVTTHSPFVIMSVDDAILYDLSKLDYINDVSLYSYESVLEGVFDELPISSILEKNIKKLSELINDKESSIKEIARLVNRLTPIKNKLDSESGYFLSQGELEIKKRGLKNV
ncbi:AAA family ATPase [Serratia marcescens]|nr:AAA family ATPase [Serratia marcescens]